MVTQSVTQTSWPVARKTPAGDSNVMVLFLGDVCGRLPETNFRVIAERVITGAPFKWSDHNLNQQQFHAHLAHSLIMMRFELHRARFAIDHLMGRVAPKIVREHGPQSQLIWRNDAKAGRSRHAGLQALEWVEQVIAPRLLRLCRPSVTTSARGASPLFDVSATLRPALRFRPHASGALATRQLGITPI